MKSIFDALFTGDIDENSRVDKTRRNRKDQEIIAYEKLLESLSEEQKTLLDKFLDAQTENQAKREKGIYSRGVKIGLKMGVEAGQYDPYDD